MKRILSFGVIAGLGVMLGCPIYSGDGTTTQPDDCTVNGCPSGFTCKLQGGNATCVANNGNDAGPGPYSGCFADTDCTNGDSGGVGYKCLNAQCTAPADQCADETQCGAGEQCVQGVCTPSCSASILCPNGYACDSNGVCSGNPSQCSVPGGSCGSNGICIEGHCDTKCGPNNTCGTGLVCVNGGCMPNQKANFICTGEDGTQSECSTGSVCLRHNCYISCETNANACATADQFNICKTVTTTSGSFQVCGSASNLGSDCDPTIGKNCAGAGVCIDGYCH
jgi:hypothetical protein